MNRNQLKERAVQLRKKGKTYSEIKQELGIQIPKSTLSYWCNRVKLPAIYREKIRKVILRNQEKSRAIALIVKKEKRNRFLESLEKNNLYLVDKLADKDFLKIILAIMHSCEGTKWKSHPGLLLGNSNPGLLRFYIELLKRCYPNVVNNDTLRCRVSHRADQDINGLNNFWSKALRVPLHHFYKSKPDPRTVGKPTKNKDYKGVCVVTSRGSGVQLELEAIAKIIFTSFIKGR